MSKPARKLTYLVTLPLLSSSPDIAPNKSCLASIYQLGFVTGLTRNFRWMYELQHIPPYQTHLLSCQMRSEDRVGMDKFELEIRVVGTRNREAGCE